MERCQLCDCNWGSGHELGHWHIRASVLREHAMNGLVILSNKEEPLFREQVRRISWIAEQPFNPEGSYYTIGMEECEERIISVLGEEMNPAGRRGKDSKMAQDALFMLYCARYLRLGEPWPIVRRGRRRQPGTTLPRWLSSWLPVPRRSETDRSLVGPPRIANVRFA